MRKKTIHKNNNVPDKTKLRYVIYARKSTEEGNRQVNSIEDQIALCQDYAARNGLNVVLPPITEQKSARYSTNFQSKPGQRQREHFAKMIELIEKGKIDGIIAYHPDRLARNMLDAGVILDMLTPRKNEKEPVLKDLAFTSINYSNDSGGRLTLAVLFSLATQYSEHLSEQVKRGIDQNLGRGKSVGTPKWGYLYNNGKYMPDGNFQHIQKGWKMILQGSSQAEVLEYWRMQDVKRMTKPDSNGNQNLIKPSKDTTGTIFRDPFYYGQLIQTGVSVNLQEKQPNFQPMITEDEYNQVQEALDSRFQTHRREKPVPITIPLRGQIICDTCQSKMYVGASGHKKSRKYVFCYCQNEHCSRREKIKNTPGLTNGIRMKDILQPIYDFLHNLKLEDNAYENYSKEIDANLDSYMIDLGTEKSSLGGILAQKRKELEQENLSYSKLVSRDDAPESVFTSAKERIASLTEIIDELDARIKEINELVQDQERLKKSKLSFLNFLQTSGDRLERASFEQKDAILRNLILNIRVNEKNEFFYLLKPELKGLFKVDGFTNFGFGQGDET